MKDALIRHAVFDWLAAQVDLHGDVLPRDVLQQGFEYQRKRGRIHFQDMLYDEAMDHLIAIQV